MFLFAFFLLNIPTQDTDSLLKLPIQKAWPNPRLQHSLSDRNVPGNKTSVNLSPCPGRGGEQSGAHGWEQGRVLPPWPGRSLLWPGTDPARRDGAASRSISCDTAHGPGLKFGPAAVKGSFFPLTSLRPAFQPTHLRLAPIAPATVAPTWS